MGSYNSINFTKLIVNGIPYNKAYMGSKILFNGNWKPFTIEALKDNVIVTFSVSRKNSGTPVPSSYYATIKNYNPNDSTATKRLTDSTRNDNDRSISVTLSRGQKIHPECVYNISTPWNPYYEYEGAVGYRLYVKVGISYSLSSQTDVVKIYGDITTWNADWFDHMFEGDCITDVTELSMPTSIQHPNEFNSMFYYTKITDLTLKITDFSQDYCCYHLLPTNSGNSILHLPSGHNYPSTNTSWLPTNWTIQEIQVEPPLQTNPITVTSLAANNRIYFKCLSATGTVKYNNNTAYQTLSEGDEITLGTIGNQETLQVKYAYTGTVSLMGTGDFTVSGDIIDVNDGVTPGMFKNSTHLTSAKNLVLSPVILTHDECYQSMFEGCTGLTSAGCPDLIATTLTESCYDSMFKGCTGLTSMVYFKFDKDIVWADYCCYGMYQGCTGIDAAEISTTGYPTYWYPDSYDMLFCYMFEGCTKLNQLYVWGDSDGYVNYFNDIIDNCSQTGLRKIFIQEDTDFMYGNVNNSNVKPTGWIVEEDDSNF